MSVVSVTKRDWSGTVAEDGHREYMITYCVRTNSESDGPAVVLASGSLPVRGDMYVSGNDADVFAGCSFVGNARRDKSDATRLLWLVDAKFTTKGSKEDPNNPPGDPLSWAWKVSGSFGAGQRYPTKDIADRAIVNTADEPFEDVPPVDEPTIILKLEKNTATVSLSQWYSAKGHVNSTEIWGLPVRTMRLLQWNWSPQFTGAGRVYVNNQFEVEVNFAGYYFKPLNVGYREKLGVDADGKATYRAITANGELIAKPAYLDTFGQRQLAGEDPVYFDGEGDNPQGFKLEYEYDFTQIFPATLPFPITS